MKNSMENAMESTTEAIMGFASRLSWASFDFVSSDKKGLTCVG